MIKAGAGIGVGLGLLLWVGTALAAAPLTTQVPPELFAPIAGNGMYLNSTNAPASPSIATLPSCGGAGQVINYTSGTGFGCVTLAAGGVTSVSNGVGDGTLSVSPTTGAVVVGLALGHANTWTGIQTFPSGSISVGELVSDGFTVNGQAVALGGGPYTITAASPNALTIVSPLSGTSYNGSAGVSIGCPSCALTSGTLAQFAATTSAQLAGVISDETGTGALVFGTSPTLTSPALGVPSAVTLTNATGLPVGTGISGLGTGMATFLATPSSANLAATVTDETGTTKLVFSNGPTLVAPVLGTPASGVATNITGLPISTGLTGAGTGVLAGLALAVNASGGIVSPTPTRAGDVVYWNGTSWTSLAGNNSGTEFLQESNAGVPSWAGSSATLTFPQSAAGTTSSGGIPYFSSATTLSSSGVLGSGQVVLGGGAGGSPTSVGTIPNTIPTQGVTSGSNAGAGNVGEYISSNVAAGAGPGYTSNVSANITSISLTAGDWTCAGNTGVDAAATSTVIYQLGSISLVSATLPTPPAGGAYASAFYSTSGVVLSGNYAISVGEVRENVSSTTTVYLVGASGFGVSTVSGFGFIGCRRLR